MSGGTPDTSALTHLPLTARAEALKLAQLLDCPIDELSALGPTGGDELRRMRQAIERRILDDRDAGFRRVARLARLLPTRMVARLAMESFGPLLSARLVARMDLYRVRNIARHISPEFVADMAPFTDPESVRTIVPQLRTELIRDAAMLLVEREDFVTMGRFADALSPQALRAVVSAIDDDATLLRTAFFLENRDQLSRVVHNIDNDRIARIMRTAAEAKLLPEALFIIDHVTNELKSRLADLMGRQDAKILDALVDVTREQALWGPVLRALGYMQPRLRRKIVNLPSVRNEALLGELVNAAYEEGLLSTALPLAKLLRREHKRVVARAALQQGEEVASAALEAAHIAGEWGLLLDLAQYVDDAQRDLLAGLAVLRRPEVVEALIAEVHGPIAAEVALDILTRAPEAARRAMASAAVADGGALLDQLLDHSIEHPDILQRLATGLDSLPEGDRPTAKDILAQREDDERERLSAAAAEAGATLVAEAVAERSAS